MIYIIPTLKSSFCVKYIIPTLITIIIFFGVNDYLTNFEKNGCDLTYMFDIPYFKVVYIMCYLTYYNYN